MTKELVPSYEGNLPDGWVLATIGELITPEGVFIDGDWVESKDQDPNGCVRLLQLADIGDGYYKNKSSRFLTKEKALELNCTFLKKGDVMLARMPDPLGRACIFPGDEKECVTVVDVCVIRSGTDDVGHKWLMYWVNSPKFRNTIASLQSGTTRRRISRGNLATITFPVPPAEQQRRIVAKIEELFSHIDAGIEALNRAKQLLKQYRQSVLKAAVTGELTKEWREQNKSKLEPASQLLERILQERRQKWEEQQLEQFKAKGKVPKDDKWKGKYKEPKKAALLVDIDNPAEWMMTSIDEVAEVFLGKMLDKSKHTKGGKLPYIRNINVRWGSVDIDDVSEMFFKDEELERYNLESGDVLVCEGGEPGRASVWYGEIENMKYQKAIHRVRFYLPLNPEYLVLLLEYFASTGLLSWYFTGSTIKHFTKESFTSLPFPLPSLEEIREVVVLVDEKIRAIKRIESDIEVSLHRAEKNKQSILASAFSGSLESS